MTALDDEFGEAQTRHPQARWYPSCFGAWGVGLAVSTSQSLMTELLGVLGCLECWTHSLHVPELDDIVITAR